MPVTLSKPAALVVLIVTQVAAQPPQTNILFDPAAWQTSSDKKNIASKNAFSSEQLLAFIFHVMQTSDLFKDLLQDNGIQDFETGPYLIKDLNHDGTLDLIATYATAGSGRFDSFVVVTAGENSFPIAPSTGLPEVDIEPAVRDLHGDGTNQIITHEGCPAFPAPALTLLNGAQKVVPNLQPCQLTHVFAWNGSELVEAGPQFAEFYLNEVIPPIQDDIKQISQTLSSQESKDIATSFYQTALFLTQQMLGIAQAGVEEAIRWTAGSSSELQLNALRVFEHAPLTEDVKKSVLRLATQSSSPILRKRAHDLVSRRGMVH